MGIHVGIHDASVHADLTPSKCPGGGDFEAAAGRGCGCARSPG